MAPELGKHRAWDGSSNTPIGGNGNRKQNIPQQFSIIWSNREENEAESRAGQNYEYRWERGGGKERALQESGAAVIT
jgi:hypothetical protein